jgi:hypothetical protein
LIIYGKFLKADIHDMVQHPKLLAPNGAFAAICADLTDP